MKKNFLPLLLIILASNLFAQISLEHTYTSEPYGPDMKIAKLSNGEKIAILKMTGAYPVITGATIQLYNMNHSLYKTVTIPFPSFTNGVSASVDVNHITDNLFKTDNKIEFIATYWTSDPNTNKSGRFVRIWDEDGTSVFSKDSAFAGGLRDYVAVGCTSMVFNSNAGAKLVIQNDRYNDKSIEVYSLPGTLLSSNQPLKKEAGKLSFPIPNPSSELTRIEFELPEGVNTGELLVYSTNGTVMKKYLVDNTFGDLLLNNTDLAPGTYYYRLSSGSAVSETKKMMIIK